MASISSLKHIDETFCLCSICSEQLKEPKLLPCLHRFCKECLQTLIKANNDTPRCPECRDEIQVVSSGEFNTDFYMKNLVEYIQIQQSLQSDKIRECYVCSKHLRVTAYCFRCNDFLCGDCHSSHMTNKLLKDHRKHTLSLEDIESKNITTEKLASMRDAPRCDTHPEKISELYCESCNFIPICVACIFGEHKGHDVHEVQTLAKSKRKISAKKLKCLEELDQEFKLTNPERAKEKLISNVTSEREKLIQICGDQLLKTKDKLQETTEKQTKLKQEKQSKEKEVFESLKGEMDEEIQRVKDKYREMFNSKKTEINDAFHEREGIVKNEVAKLTNKLQLLKEDQNSSLESLRLQLKNKSEEIAAASEYFDNTKKRFQNLRILGSTIIESENDWTAVQCIPDIETGADNLMKELKHELSDLDKMTFVTVNHKQFSFGRPTVTKLSDQVETVVNLDKMFEFVNGMTTCGDGKIVVSGYLLGSKQTFVSVTNENGKIIRQKKLSTDAKPWHSCEFVSQNKVVTAFGNTICIYDTLHDSHFKRNIRDIVSSWPEGRDVRCLATDPGNNHIFVRGYGSREVYLFDNELTYLHILTLPGVIHWLYDMTFNDGNLLVCNCERKVAYATSIDGLNVKVIGEFKAISLGDDCIPLGICADKNGMVYKLWYISAKCQCHLAQYNHDGRVTAKRTLDSDVHVSTVTDTREGENSS